MMYPVNSAYVNFATEAKLKTNITLCHAATLQKNRSKLNEKLQSEFNIKLDCSEDLVNILSSTDPNLQRMFSNYILTYFTKQNTYLESRNNNMKTN